MPGPILDVKFNADEVIAMINSKRRKLVTAVESKMGEVMERVADTFLEGKTSKVGMYIDPRTIDWGVQKLGVKSILGYVESRDKGGTYVITPVEAKMLVFFAKSGDLVRTKLVNRPYLKGSKFLPEHFLEMKPWIEDQLEDAVIDAL